MSLYKELIALEASGFSEDELDRFAKQRIAVLQGSGFGPADIAKELGRPIREILP